MQAVIMAGGFGKRLRPLTDDIPKPMLEVGGEPLLQRTIAQLSQAGLCRIGISLGYLADTITDYFGDGSNFGVEIKYIREDQPLGTAGALGLAPLGDGPVLVTNGDILTQIDYGAMLAHHHRHEAALTVAVHNYSVQVPYGVVEGDGTFVTSLREKPDLECCINAGIYVLSPSVHRAIQPNVPLNMSELIEQLLAERRPVAQFPFVDYWLDIGQPAEYKKAQRDIITLRNSTERLAGQALNVVLSSAWLAGSLALQPIV